MTEQEEHYLEYAALRECCSRQEFVRGLVDREMKRDMKSKDFQEAVKHLEAFRKPRQKA